MTKKRLKKGRIALCVLLILAVNAASLAGGFMLGRYTHNSQEESAESAIKMGAEANVSEAEKPMPSQLPQQSGSPEVSEALASLRAMLEAEIANYEGVWSVYVANLSGGGVMEINNHKMVSASLIKLFIMGSIYQDIEAGVIVPETVEKQLYDMITVSDNEASNLLVATLGGGTYTDMYGASFQAGLKKVNDFATSLGCMQTEQQRDMKNSRPTPITEQNYCSVADCGNLLSKLYYKQLVSPASDELMLELLKKQTRREKIPAGLPAGTLCANKTGELSNVENDVAIVWSPGADYALCVMSNEVPDTSAARQNIAKISNLVYEFFNTPVPEPVQE